MKRVIGVLKRLAGVAVVAAVGYGAWIGYQGLEADQEDSTLGQVPTEAAAARDITVSVSAAGTLRPVRIVQVKSKAAGEILNMPVDLGDRVHAGDLIAQIDTETLEQELAQAQADLESARVRLEVAEKQYRRAQELAEQDLVSRQDLDNSHQSYTTARGQLLRAEAELKLRQERLDDATVRAPVDGTIIKKNVEEGTIIQSSVSSLQGGTTLVEMADLTTLEVRTLVDEIDIGRVQPGLPVETTVEAYPDRKFAGEVVKIEPQAVIEQQVTTFPVLSYVDNHEGLLLPGMNADVEIVIHRRPGVLAVRNEAVKSPADAARVADLLGLPLDERAPAARPGGGPAGSGTGDALAAVERPRSGSAAKEPAGRGRGADGTAAPAGGGAAAGEPDATNARVAVGEVSGGGGQEAKADDGEVDLSRLRTMSPEERRRFFENMTDEQRRKLRERFAAARGGAGGRAGSAGGGFRGGSDSGRGGGVGAGGAGGDGFGGVPGAADTGARPGVSMEAFGIDRAPQPAVVFVLDEQGAMHARRVMIGVQDWEYTEIVAGLRPGERVVLLPSTSLLMSQQALRERFSRFSQLPGTGGRRR